MWIQSHLLATVVVFGPRPEALIGALVPDIFSSLNGITKFATGKLDKTVILQGEVEIEKATNDGAIWEAHTFMHSFWMAGLILAGTIFFLKTSPSLAIFLGSYFLHIFIDYFTHKIKWWPLIPYKGWRTSFGVYEYSLKNWRTVVVGDLVLSVLVLIRSFPQLFQFF